MKRKLAAARRARGSSLNSAGSADDDAPGEAATTNPSGRRRKTDEEVLHERAVVRKEIRSKVPYRNKRRCLILPSRGITSRQRHLIEDIKVLMPHHRTEFKHDTKKNLHEINALAELKRCDSVLFFESRKRADLYMWASFVPNGPCIKFLVNNIHTMDELKLTGNSLKGSRPALSFSANFDDSPHNSMMKEVLTQVFNTPKGHPKSKPFVDRVMQFSLLDEKIWVRNYQILDETMDSDEMAKLEKAYLKNPHSSTESPISLVEIGPRCVLNPWKIFEGSFRGSVLWDNPSFIKPNDVRAAQKAMLGRKYDRRKMARAEGYANRIELSANAPMDPMRNLFDE